MRLWTKLEEENSFGKLEKVRDNFIPLAYANGAATREVDIVGTDQERRSIIILRQEKGVYTEKTRIPVSVAVDYVIPGDLNLDGQIEYLVVTNIRDNRFQLTLVGRQPEMDLTTADEMPLIFSDRALTPTLFVQKDQATYFVTAVNNVLEIKKSHLSFGKLRRHHSSGYVDATGDGFADLVLDTERGGQRVIELWRNSADGFIKTDADLYLEDEDTGALSFGDFTGSGAVDIMYPKNAPHAKIVIIPNKRLPYCTLDRTQACLDRQQLMKPAEPSGFDLENLKEYAVSPDDQESRFLLQTSRGPVFPAVLDIDRDSYPDMLMVFEQDTPSGKQTYTRLYKNLKGRGFEAVANHRLELPDNAAIQGASFLGSGKGVSDIFVAAADTTDQLPFLAVSKNLSDFSGYHLTISTVYEEPGHDSVAPVIGTTYACRIVETGKIIVGFYPPQSGYAPMQSPITTVGLGKTNVFIGSLHTRVPSWQYQLSVTEDKIVPNSELIMYVSRHQIRPALYLNTNEYWSVAIPIMLTLLFVSGMVSVFFTFKERKKSSRLTGRRGLYNMNFEAL